MYICMYTWLTGCRRRIPSCLAIPLTRTLSTRALTWSWSMPSALVSSLEDLNQSYCFYGVEFILWIMLCRSISKRIFDIMYLYCTASYSLHASQLLRSYFSFFCLGLYLLHCISSERHLRLELRARTSAGTWGVHIRLRHRYATLSPW